MPETPRSKPAPLTQEEIELWQLLEAQAEADSILGFVKILSPEYEKPAHLKPLAEIFYRAHKGEEVRACLSVPPRFGKPLHEDTLITMANGSLRPIKNIRVGDLLISGTGQHTKVTAVYDQGELDVYKIKTLMGREVIAEKSHRFLTQSGWKKLIDLRVYNRNNWQRPRADQLMAGAQYKISPDSFLSEDEGRFFGYMIGDGNSTQKNCRWTNIDPVLRDKFCTVVRNLGGETSVHDSQTFGVIKSNKAAPHLRKLLVKHDIAGKKAAEKTVPSSIFRAPDSVVKSFIAAYFECDGMRTKIYPNGRTGTNASFSSMSFDLLSGVQHLLARFGIRSALYRKRGRYKGQIHLSWLLSIHDQQRFFKEIPILGKKSGAVNTSKRFQRDKLLPDTLRSVEAFGKAHCYCITVDKDDSFLANGLITHNTETILAAIAWYFTKHPDHTVAYVSYSAEIAEAKSRRARDLAAKAGVRMRKDAQKLAHWQTLAGGGFMAVGAGGPLTGFGCNLLIIDDIIKNREEAESDLVRQRTFDWFTSTAMTRVEPKGSVLVNGTRWHPNDLIGSLIEPQDTIWEHCNLSALTDKGESLWPNRWPADKMQERRKEVGEYDFASLFMGQPRPKGIKLFKDPARFIFPDVEPGARYMIGVDPAATAKTTSDYSVIVVLSARGHGLQQVVDVIDVFRGQIEIPMLVDKIVHYQKQWRAPIACEAVGGFVAIPQMLRRINPAARILPVKVTTDKFTRALPLVAAWNDNRIRLPEQAPWIREVLNEVLSFSGTGDKHDDIVDALAHAYTAISQSAPGVTRGPDIAKFLPFG